MTTSNMSLNEPTVGTTAGPDWATETNANWALIDAHDHTSGKGTQLGPSALNINADLEFNQNSATELKNLIFDSSVTAAATNYSIYQSGGNLYWRNNSGANVQITDGSALNISGSEGRISGMSSTAVVLFGSNSYAFKFDVASSVGMNHDGMAKMSFADIDLYKYDAAGSLAKVTLKFLGSGTSAAITVPDETGTLLTTSTSFAGAISIATSASDGNISLSPNGTGEIVIGNGSASGKITTNSTQDLVLDTNAGTNSGNITITDGTNGEITIDTHGTGDINLTAGADVNIPSGIGLTFGNDGEKIEGNGTKLDIAASELDFSIESGGDINIGTDIGLTFGNDGEKIEGNGTKLDIAAAELDFSIESGGDINIGADIGLTFGDDGEKIEGDGTDLTIASSGEINVNSGTLDLSAQTVDVTLNGAVDALNFDSNTLSIDASNNRIGIGTNAPNSILNISDSGGFTTLIITDPTENASGEHWYFRNTGGNFYLGQSTDSGGAWDSLQARVTVLDGGNVGIGTTSPSCALHVHTENSASTNYLVQRWGNSTTTHGYVDFQLVNPGSTASGFPRLDLEIGNSSIMSFVRGGNVGIGTTAPTSDGGTTLEIYDANTPTLRLNDGGDYKALFQLRGNDTEIRGSSGNMEFYTGAADGASSTVGMLINSSGNVGIGASSPGTALDVQNGEFNGQIIARSTANSYQQRFIACYANTTTHIGSIRRVNATSALEFVTGSDRRIKKDIIPTSNVLDKLLKIKIYDFKYKENDELGNGPIAQELLEHFPELVGKTDDGLGEKLPEGVESWTVGSHMNWILTKAIQELSAKVTALEGA